MWVYPAPRACALTAHLARGMHPTVSEKGAHRSANGADPHANDRKTFHFPFAIFETWQMDALFTWGGSGRSLDVRPFGRPLAR
jgi:hypothetical protein